MDARTARLTLTYRVAGVGLALLIAEAAARCALDPFAVPVELVLLFPLILAIAIPLAELYPGGNRPLVMTDKDLFRRVNPATGLAMVGSVDTGGNAYGSGHSSR